MRSQPVPSKTKARKAFRSRVFINIFDFFEAHEADDKSEPFEVRRAAFAAIDRIDMKRLEKYTRGGHTFKREDAKELGVDVFLKKFI